MNPSENSPRVAVPVGASVRPGDRVRVIHRTGFVDLRCPRCNALCCKASPGSVVEIVCHRCNDMMVAVAEK